MMMKPWIKKLLLIGACFTQIAFGQSGPIQGGAPIKLVVPFTPGTGPDTIARAVAPKLSEKMGQPVIVDNRAGASGNIGTEAVVRAKPDGTTLLVTVNTIVMNRSLYPKATFDPLTDLVPMTLAAYGDLVLVVPSNSPYKNVAEFLAAAKSNPGKLTYGSPGIGTPHHLGMEALEHITGVKILHVPYEGTAPAVTDLLGSQIDSMFLPVHVANGHIKSGKLRALAIGSKKRNPIASQIPTFSELKIGEIDVSMWFGMMAPKGVPNDDLNRLSNALREILVDSEIKTIFAAQGLDPATSSSQAFKEIVEKDALRWAKIIKDQGITAE
jgi:tripartite-type tricarboxylate transporter receptor subunit TctC